MIEDNQSIAHQNNQSVTLRIDPKIPENAVVSANEGYLYRAFDNVIRNAINYSPEGSTIQAHIGQDGKNWIIDVTDNGPGVDECSFRIFSLAFYRADSSAHKPGTGLGLAFDAAHLWNSTAVKIIAENVKPNGLRMRFILPKKKAGDKKEV